MPIGALGDAGRQVFHLLRRLREELKVNTTCGASNISFGLPQPPRPQRRPSSPMVIGAGMTSAITNPLHAEEMTGIMGADVLMGNDAHCARWIAKFREPASGPGEACAAGRRGRRGAGAPARRSAMAPAAAGRGRDAWPVAREPGFASERQVIADHDALLVCSCRRASAGAFPVGTPMLEAARKLGVDIDSVCGGRGICGRCQIEVSEGEFAKLGRHVEARSPLALRARWSSATPTRRGMKPKAAACPARRCCRAISSSTCRRTARCIKQVVRKRAEMRAIEIDPVVQLHYVEVDEPDMHDPSGDLQRLKEALETQWDLTGLDCDLRAIQGLQKALRKGEWTVTVAVHQDKQITAVWPGFQDEAFGLACRYRLDHHRRASLRSRLGRCGRLGRRDEPADPLRRGSDEPRLLRDDESRRRADMTSAVRDAVNDLVASVATEAGVDVRRHPRGHLRRQSDHASPAARHRSDGAGRGAVRAGHRRAGADLGVGDRPQHPSERARLRAALHRRPCRRRHRRRHPLGSAARPATR